MCEKKKILEKFLRILEKKQFNIKNDELVKHELNIIMGLDFNIKHQNTTIEYYKKIYPQFDDNVHKLLSRCARVQKYDFRKNNRLKFIKTKTIIEFY